VSKFLGVAFVRYGQGRYGASRQRLHGNAEPANVLKTTDWGTRRRSAGHCDVR